MGREIPFPDVPIWPVLSLSAFQHGSDTPEPSILDGGSGDYVPAGRYAICLALRLAELSPGDKVLLPAYHCSAMIDPVTYVSAKPVFYKINEDLSVDLDDIINKVDHKTRAIIIVNYFGFPQDLETLRRLCDERKLLMIEDCAHSFFGAYRGQALGSYGDYAIASLPKFFPVNDGGCLVSRSSVPFNFPLFRQGLGYELRQCFLVLENATYHNRMVLMRPLMNLIEGARSLRPRPPDGQQDPSNGLDPGLLSDFEREALDKRASAISEWISRHVSFGRIVKKRRSNFEKLLQHFSSHPGCHPLMKNLPLGVVPYMFPLWVENLDTVFPKLEDRAVPMQRFGQFLSPEVDENLCRASIAFSKNLLQLPCHQDLRPAELDWIINTVSSTICEVA